MQTHTSISDADSARSPFRGLGQIVRFNWPQYVVGFACIVAASIGLATFSLPSVPRWLIASGILAAGWWLLASLVASLWIYDRSPLTGWRWLRPHLPNAAAAQRFLNVHSGFDDSTRQLQIVFPEARVQIVDLFDESQMTEPSIRRARQAMPPLAGTLGGAADRLPIDSVSLDAVFLLLAAHELRRPAEREALFAEVARVLQPGGRVILAEHARDAWNFMAFGPGFFHFLPYGEWLRLARGADLKVTYEGRVTPFIRTLVLQKP
jgi:SAM-dependent methyltransferase